MKYQLKDGSLYEFRYPEVKRLYDEHISMSDEEFMKNIPSALHLASFICWIKEIPSEECLSDKGIIHELIHLLHIPNEPLIVLKDIRELFKVQLELV